MMAVIYAFNVHLGCCGSAVMVFDVKRFDIYRKVPKDLTQPTLTGAIISISCVLFIAFLFFSELVRFLTVEVVSELYVDDPGDEARIPVVLNITTPFLGCEYVGLDIQDEMGRHEVGFVENTVKTPVENGCKFEAKFFVNRVPGNFHISTHSAATQPSNPDMRHIIHTVAFGQDVTHKTNIGAFNALKERRTTENSSPLNSHDYILKVVPSIYESLDDHKVFAFQYTYAHKEYISYHHSGQVVPAIWFRYDLSPITVKYSERRQPFYTFLTTVCAIVGGTFTVAGIIDSFVFTASEFYKKFEIGKLN